MQQNPTNQFLDDLEQMPIEHVRSHFRDLFAEALAIEDAEHQQASQQESSNETSNNTRSPNTK